jgi:2-polyprenyl-3-methyl-5-hydroxy-6-metoxy-1,4-benzoquinol methylase
VSAVSDHWEQVYETTSSAELSWYEQSPTTSARLITSAVSSFDAAVIDVGGGASLLVDHLVDEGFADLTILDVSAHALDEVQRRLGSKARRVTFLHRDVLEWSPTRHFDVWHDRAVFHFLTDPTDRDGYVATSSEAVSVGGAMVLGTFAQDGPTRCSGLAVSRYSPHDLEAFFSPSFSLVHQEREQHVTPRGVVQPFTWVVLQRT